MLLPISYDTCTGVLRCLHIYSAGDTNYASFNALDTFNPYTFFSGSSQGCSSIEYIKPSHSFKCRGIARECYGLSSNGMLMIEQTRFSHSKMPVFQVFAPKIDNKFDLSRGLYLVSDKIFTYLDERAFESAKSSLIFGNFDAKTGLPIPVEKCILLRGDNI